MSGNILVGKRLRLRPATVDDIPTLYKWYSDPSLMSLYDGVQFPVEDFETFRESYSFWLENEVEMGFGGSFMMELIETNRSIGECTWVVVDRTGPDSPGVYQVGGLISPQELRGKGLGTEALLLLRDYLFRDLHAHRLESMTYAFNSGAMKTLHHCGFTREGVLREAVLSGDQWQDRVLFSVLRREWRAGRIPSS